MFSVNTRDSIGIAKHMSVTISGLTFQDGQKIHIYTVQQMVSGGGSMLFNGADSNLMYAGSSDWAMGTTDFTIEWFQNQVDPGAHPRVFSVGVYPSASIAVSIEGGSLYFWMDGSEGAVATLDAFLNTWTHIALVRIDGTVSIYQDGVLLSSNSSSQDISDSSTPLYIGSEEGTGSFFEGNLTNFRWINGIGVYSSNFTPPSAPLTAITDTVLLLDATSVGTVVTDTSGQNQSATNTDVTWDAGSPF